MQKTLYIPIDTTIDNLVECEKLIKRGDTLTLTIKVFVNGVLADLTGESIDLILKKSDNTLIENTIDTSNISNGVITAKLNRQATLAQGLVTGEAQIYTNDTLSSTNTFTYTVDASLADDVLEVSKDDIQVLGDLRNLINSGQITINKYNDCVLAIGNSVDAIEALANVKAYIDTKLPALESENAKAVVNTPALKAQNDKAPGLTANLKTENDKAPALTTNLKSENDRADINIPALTTANDTAEELKNTLETDITNANKSKSALDTSKTNADASKVSLDTSITKANDFVTEHSDIENLVNQVNSNTASLSQIQNQTYITEKAKIVDVNTALGNKADINYVNTKIGNMGNTKIFKGSCTNAELLIKTGMIVDDYWYVTDKTSNYCYNGTSWIDIGNNLKIGNSTITEKLIAPFAVTPDKTNFIEHGKNYLDLSTKSALGWWCNYNWGNYESTQYVTNYYYSAPILVTPGTQMIRRHGEDGTVFFDSNMVFISGKTSGTFTVPNNATFMVVNFTNAHLNEQVELGTVSTEQEDYCFKLSNHVPKSIPTSALVDGNTLFKTTDVINQQMIAPFAVTPDKTNFIEHGKNYLDLSTKSALGWWCNYNWGNYESTQYITNYYYSAPILVTPGTQMIRRHGEDGTVFFDSNMVFISGKTSGTFTVPNNATFMVVNFTNAHLNEQVELGTVSTEQEDYCFKLSNHVPKSIPTSALVDGEELVALINDPSKYQLNLPKKIFGVVGREVNIYLDNLMIDDASKYNFNVECAVGIQQADRWTAIPSATIGTNLSMLLYKDCEDTPISNTVSTLYVAPVTAGNGLNKKYMQIGDSTTWNLMNYGYLLQNFTDDVMSLTQIGTQGTGTSKHEGYPGQDTAFIFTNASSPFVFNGIFDFSQYMTTQGYDGVDFVTLSMGINDMYAMQSDAQANAKIALCMAQYEDMITSIHAYNPAIKVGILLTIPPAKSQDAFGADGSNAQTQFRHSRSIVLWVRQCIAQFTGRETSNIFVVPYNSNLDTVNNFAYQSAQISARNPTIILRQANALHPDYEGCWQMADSIYFWIKNMV